MWRQLMVSQAAFGMDVKGEASDEDRLVRWAARVSGGRGHARVLVDHAEHRRRAAFGLSAVVDLTLLDALLGLPAGEQVSWADLDAEAARRLRKAPEGVLECTSGGVRRLLAPAATVSLVVVPALSWRSGLRRAAAFQPFAARVVLVDVPPGPDLLWEADVLGVGVWRDRSPDPPEELLPPAPWRCVQVKAAGWRFRERAYGTWFNAQVG